MQIDKFRLYYHYNHPDDYIFPGHRHNEWELNVILRGSMEITDEGNVFTLRAGDAMLIPPNGFHQNRVVGNLWAEMLVAHFKTNECISGAYRLNSDAASLTSLLIKEAEREGLREEAALRLSENAKKLLELLLSELERCDGFKDGRPDAASRIYQNAILFMKEHICESLSTERIARAVGVCKTTLKKIFQHYTGMGCMRFFGEMKLTAAKAMLEKGESCSSVSEALGFSSQAYFSKKFKEFFGILPSKSVRNC